MTEILTDLELSSENRKKFDELCDNLINALSSDNRDELLKRDNLSQLNYLSSVQSIFSTYRWEQGFDDGIYAEIFFTYKGLQDTVNKLKLQGKGRKRI